MTESQTPVQQFEAKRQRLKHAMERLQFGADAMDSILASVLPHNIDDLLGTVDDWEDEDRKKERNRRMKP